MSIGVEQGMTELKGWKPLVWGKEGKSRERFPEKLGRGREVRER